MASLMPASSRARVWLVPGTLALASVLVAAAAWFGRAGDNGNCQLIVPNSSIDPLVFPSKGGAATLDAAIVDDVEPAAIVRLMREQGAFAVERGTRCSKLEAGPVYMRVLLTAGSSAGKAVWVPASHARCGS